MTLALSTVEQVERLTSDEARAITEKIRQTLDDLLALIIRAYQGEADKALGYRSWEAYVAAEFPSLPRFNRLERRDAMHALSEAGMTTRNIAGTLGVSKGTVNRDSHAHNGAGQRDAQVREVLQSIDETVVDAAVVEAPVFTDEREAQVAEMLKQRVSQRDIARQMHMSKSTVNVIAQRLRATIPAQRTTRTDNPQRHAIEERKRRLEEMGLAGVHPDTIAHELGYRNATSVRTAARKFGIKLMADVTDKTRRPDANRFIEEMATALESHAMAIRFVRLDDVDPSTVDGWVTSITESLRILGTFARQIKKETS